LSRNISIVVVACDTTTYSGDQEFSLRKQKDLELFIRLYNKKNRISSILSNFSQIA
jgi:hypothetical protein